MKAERNIDVTLGVMNAVGIGTGVNYTQKWITELYY